MTERSEKSRIAILKALDEAAGPVGASSIHDHLLSQGIHLQPRTIRHYLAQLDGEGLTHFVSRRRGREITDQGRRELAQANIIEKLGFAATRVDNLGYQKTFNLRSGAGSIVTNVAVVDDPYMTRALEDTPRMCVQQI